MLSAFEPLGLMELTSATSRAENIYNALWASLGDNYAQGGHTDAKVFATAMGLAALMKAADHLVAQIKPSTVLDLLPAREYEYGIVVPATATIPQRRAVLSVALLLAVGGTYSNIRQALINTLGPSFVSYRTTPVSEMVTFPANLAAPPCQPTFSLPGVVRALATLSTPISTGLATGFSAAPQAVALASYQGLSLATYRIGDQLTIEPESLGLTESVRVTAVSGATVTISCNNAHPAGAIVLRGAWPAWVSSKRFSLVALSTAAMLDPNQRRLAHNLMAQMARVVSTWGLAQTSGTGTTGPFCVGEGLIGLDTIGLVTLPP